jgi:hypothetical protein
LESALRERTTKGKQGMQTVVSREKVSNNSTYAKSTVNYTGRLVEANRQEEVVDNDNHVIKNTFNPKSVRERLSIKKDIGPRAPL